MASPITADSTASAATPPSSTPDWIALVREKVESLRYGVVQIVVHDGRFTRTHLKDPIAGLRHSRLSRMISRPTGIRRRLSPFQ